MGIAVSEPRIATGPRASAVPAARPVHGHLHYLDYLRAATVALVFVHHTAVTYAGVGSWYYLDGGASALARALLTMLLAFDQSWFMGFLFFLSGYLSIPSYTRKGARRYLADRVRRFGIPLVVYLFGISPVATWLALAARPGTHPSLFTWWCREYLSLRILDPGVLWFLMALLVMDALFAVWARSLSRLDLTARPGGAFPTRWALAGFAVALGLVSFVVRLGMPVGATFLSLQLAYFPSYVAMFVLGLVSWRMRWLDAIPDTAFRMARWMVLICGVLLAAELLRRVAVPSAGAVAASTLARAISASRGGLHWQALATALWEQWVLVGMSIILLRWGQQRLNRPSRLWQGWAGASYTAYIIQPLVLVPLAVLFQSTPWPVLDKFAVVASLSVVATYALARLVRLIPPLRAVLG